MSPNRIPHFSDEEVMTVYLWGTLRGYRAITQIHDYAQDHLHDWFPRLPAYQTFVGRLNRLGSVFAELAMRWISCATYSRIVDLRHVIDSIPIVMAIESRRYQAKVASEFANCGYCATKDLHYYGVKLHMVALRRPHALPIPDVWSVTPASPNDITVLQELADELHHYHIIGDRAYPDEDLQHQFQEHRGQLQTPIKRKRNQPPLTLFQKAYNTLVSKIRQPIESLMEWINDKTGIQSASRVRSLKGLLVHVCGKLSIAIWLFFNNFNS